MAILTLTWPRNGKHQRGISDENCKKKYLKQKLFDAMTIYKCWKLSISFRTLFHENNSVSYPPCSPYKCKYLQHCLSPRQQIHSKLPICLQKRCLLQYMHGNCVLEWQKDEFHNSKQLRYQFVLSSSQCCSRSQQAHNNWWWKLQNKGTHHRQCQTYQVWHLHQHR